MCLGWGGGSIVMLLEVPPSDSVGPISPPPLNITIRRGCCKMTFNRCSKVLDIKKYSDLVQLPLLAELAEKKLVAPICTATASYFPVVAPVCTATAS